MNEKFETLTPEELELLEKLSPEMFGGVQAGGPTAAMVARAYLKAKERAEAKPPAPASPLPPPAVQLPLWPEPVRAVPNGFLRSALFGAIRKGRRAMLDNVQLAAINGVTLVYTGPRLDQSDLDTWESVLHFLRAQNMGKKCRTTSYALLKLLGLSDTGKNRKILEARLFRLKASAIQIRCGRYLYMGSLLDWAAKDEETQEWVITLNPALRSLFADEQYTLIRWDVRRALSGQPLAQWLHGFYASHAEPYSVKIETLQKLSGSEAGELWKFTQTLKKALDAVARACAAHGERFAWSISDGLVHVSKTPTQAQRRYLVKRDKKTSRL